MTLHAVSTWVFDLDNTLYPRSARLFDQIEAKMEAFICNFLTISVQEAKSLRSTYWSQYGTTLRGLMEVNGMEPEPFMKDVHDIDLSHLLIDDGLAKAITGLPGRKIVYTNGSRRHAERVLDARGLADCFDALYGVEHADYVPKPRAEAFQKIISKDGFDPQKAAMFEDEERNLEVPHSLGMGTILVGETRTAPYTQFETHDLTDFLSQWQEDGRAV